MKERLERLAEACELIKSLFANETTTSASTTRSRTRCSNPKPVQCRYRRSSAAAAREVTPAHRGEVRRRIRNVWGDVATLTHKMGLLDRYCAEVGRSPRAIQRSAVALLFLTDDRRWSSA